MKDWSILLVDSVTLPRRGLRAILESECGLKVIGEAEDLETLFSLLRDLRPDMIILDASLPDVGIETLPEIRSIHTGIKVLIIAAQRERELLYGALRWGADGYLLKEDSAEEFLLAVKKIRQDDVYISPTVPLVIAGIRAETDKKGEKALTKREREVLRLVAQGMSSKAIGAALYISAYTVERHRANIMRKLNVKKNTDLVKHAIYKGII